MQTNLKAPCACVVLDQGNEHLLFNVNNRYLVHYRLLNEYSELLRNGKNPLFGFVRHKLNISNNIEL